MGQILLGIVAFALGFAFDWASWRRIRGLKPLLGLAVIACFGYALVWTLATPGRFPWPAWTAVIGWPVLAVGAALLIYSLFLEIPFATTYARSGAPGALVTTGTYALVRHPGVLWFAVWALGCVLVSRSQLMAVAGAVWFLADVVYVWLQETWLFPRMFAGYASYQRETPMLVPTRRSIERCLQTVSRRRP